jgi:hypothetical protein
VEHRPGVNSSEKKRLSPIFRAKISSTKGLRLCPLPKQAVEKIRVQIRSSCTEDDAEAQRGYIFLK